MLKAMGIEEEKVDQIIEAHTETVDALKTQAKEAEEKAKDVDKLQGRIDELEEEAKDAKKDSWKVKYDALKEEFEEYKTAVETEKTTKAKEQAYRDLLKEVGVSEKRIPAVMKVTDLKDLEFKDGGFAVKDEIVKNIKEEWADFIVQGQTVGTKTSNPPQNNGKTTMTKAEIMAIKDGKERRQKIAENPQLFGLE